MMWRKYLGDEVWYNPPIIYKGNTMATVEFLGPIGRAPVEVNVDNLAELKAHFKDDAQLSEWLEICSVAVNDTLVCSLETPIKTGDKISLLPPVCGG
jgi:molybdopterin synthase sulfur carrier subunit